MPSRPDLSASRGLPAPASDRATLLDRLMRAPLVRRFFRLPAVQRVLAPARGDRSVHKFIRYSMVSCVAIVISQVVILVCTWLLGLSGVAANTIGAVAATPASYELNRKWAWGKSGKSHMWKEVAPFWALTVLGYLGSTGTVQIADSMAKSHDVTGLPRGLAIMGASLFAYGVVWIVKFVIFNRLVFATRPARDSTQLAAEGEAVCAGDQLDGMVSPVVASCINGATTGHGAGGGAGQKVAPAFEVSGGGR
jgi:putative flippase GtrA